MDLTLTQYAAGLDWLTTLGFLADGPDGLDVVAATKTLPEVEANRLLFERTLAKGSPAWLPDADLLVPNSRELPQDAESLAGVLGLTDDQAWLSLRQVHGRIDLAAREEIGSAGELGLLELIEATWPGATEHVAKSNDGFGYDLVFRHRQTEWHLEVKATTRCGRLSIHLSRHEYEVGLRDPFWRLVVVGLGADKRLAAVATLRSAVLRERAPNDRDNASTWQVVRHHLQATDLAPGMNFLDEPERRKAREALCLRGGTPQAFAWMPSADIDGLA